MALQTYDDSGASGEFNLFNKALASVCPERPGFLLPGSDVADTRDAAAETKKIRAVAAGAPAGAVDGTFVCTTLQCELRMCCDRPEPMPNRPHPFHTGAFIWVSMLRWRVLKL